MVDAVVKPQTLVARLCRLHVCDLHQIAQFDQIAGDPRIGVERVHLASQFGDAIRMQRAKKMNVDGLLRLQTTVLREEGATLATLFISATRHLFPGQAGFFDASSNTRHMDTT